MDTWLACIEAVMAIGFVVFGYQRWQMSQLASATLCFVLASYFGRISLLYAGRAWDWSSLERVANPNAIFTNAALVLLALVMSIAEAHEQGFAEWRRRWKERHK